MRTILVYFLTTLTVLGELPADWKNVQQFDVARTGLIKLGLPAETIDAARPGLEDLRIFDSAGREVPYLIERPVRNTVVVFTPKKFSVSLSGQATVITLETGSSQTLDALVLETPTVGFIKAVTVEGSNDQHTWRTLTSGKPIFRQPNGVNQLQVEFPEGPWPFLRVTIDDRRAEAIPFTGATLHAVTEGAAPGEPLPVTITDRTESDGQTRLTLDLGAAHLILTSLRIETAEPLFTRSVTLVERQVAENAITERELARDTIYRVDIEGFKRAERLDLPLDLTVHGRELLVLIDNADSQPLQISAMRATRWPVFAVFLAQQAGPYQVVTGNPHCAAPRYDLTGLRGTLASAPSVPIAALSLSALVANPAYHPTESFPEIQDLGTVLDMAEWGYRKPIKLPRAGVQQLDLDLDVLARADATFRDLRLVRDGKQCPYVLERTSISRKLVPEISSANDPKRPTVSRWKIKLPHTNLPITRLTAVSTSGLFRRQVTLYEQPVDERGEKYDRQLGQANWVRTPPATKAPLELMVGARPLTDTLILETDNGDNPPIDLANFQFFYPVTRVLFKAPPEPSTYLYYGNHDAAFPQYDLDLIAPRLLAEEKSVASLSTEETLKKSGVGEAFQISGTKSIIFWVALTVVVLVLLVVIAKLLPKSPPVS
jgi:hypothetical protein